MNEPIHDNETPAAELPPPLPPRARGRVLSCGRHYPTAVKMGAILILVLLLLIPLKMIQSVLSERLTRRDEAIANITSTWGGEQLVAGPVLVVPYGLLYVILCQQDYSLLFGTVGLFVALGVVMYATRHIDWYARDEK